MEILLSDVRCVRDGREVLAVPRLALRAGCTTVLFGPNGAGKTTLLRLVAGLERPAAGRVLIGDALAGTRAAARRVAFAFQEAVFLRGTVRDNLVLALRLRGVPAPERARRIDDAAGRCEVSHLLARRARALSGGEAQRVSVARALALRAPVTLLDEPLAGLDRGARERLLGTLPALLRAFTRTAVVVTHDRHEALRLGDDLVVLADGAVKAAGEKAAVWRGVTDVQTAELLGYTVLRSEAGTVAVPPGGLVLGDGPGAMPFVVEEVVDLGSHREALGWVDGARVGLPLAPDARVPAPGARLPVRLEGAVRLAPSPGGGSR